MFGEAGGDGTGWVLGSVGGDGEVVGGGATVEGEVDGLEGAGFGGVGEGGGGEEEGEEDGRESHFGVGDVGC
jgi:hypothetical protein